MANTSLADQLSYSGLDDARFADIKRALVVSAHPDDLDFGAAGTVALLRERGVEVEYAIVTDGDAGGFDADTHDTIVETRHREQRAAAARVGVATVHFLGYRDGALEPSPEVVRDLVKVMRAARPDVVICMSPERHWDRIQASHPDHLASGEAAVRAVYPAVENPFAFPELLEAGYQAHKVSWLWMYAAPERLVNMAVDVTASVDKKLAALHEHVSQHPDPSGMQEMVLGMLATNAQTAGLSGYAEVFHVAPVNAPSTFAGF